MFVADVVPLMRAGKQIIYIDETTFHKQILCSRAWVKRTMELPKPQGRGKGVTVLGAISEKQGLVHFKVLQTTNDGRTFSKFIQELLRKVKGEAHVYMDNLTVHTATSV